VLSVLNHDSAVASAAARMVLAAGGRPLLEMGGRRTHEQAAVAAARAAYVAGFAMTSNLEAGRRHGIPTAGTSAHAFTLAHRTEVEAFRSQVATLGAGTTLLVDTYDTVQGIRNAVEVAGTGLGAVRLDSGDPQVEVPRARALLDELGATSTRIVVTGDLDEHTIAELVPTAADAFGVGTSVVTGSGAPTAGFVYKLVAVAQDDAPGAPCVPVAKRSAGKSTVGGRKWAFRTADGREVLRDGPEGAGRPLQAPLPALEDLAAPAPTARTRWPPCPTTRAGSTPASRLDRREGDRAMTSYTPAPRSSSSTSRTTSPIRRAVSASAAGSDVVAAVNAEVERATPPGHPSSTRRTGTRPTPRTSPRTAAPGRCTASRGTWGASCTRSSPSRARSCARASTGRTATPASA
jgi:hypothetical protein